MSHPATKELTEPATAARGRAYGRRVNIALWTLQVLSALAFLAAGICKVAGAPMMVAEFEHIGLGQWFRHLTGLLEVLAAVALLVPRSTFHSATLLAMVMASALFAHAAVLGMATAMPAFILLVLNAAIAYFRRPWA